MWVVGLGASGARWCSSREAYQCSFTKAPDAGLVEYVCVARAPTPPASYESGSGMLSAQSRPRVGSNLFKAKAGTLGFGRHRMRGALPTCSLAL